jgi:two-component system, cell cycle response regulator DivK
VAKSSPTKPPASDDAITWRVLLAEDVEDLREIFGVSLRFAGFDVVVAQNGPEALAAVERDHPDLILMDVSMPGIDGWEATRRLKTDPATQGIPIIILSAHVFEDSRRRAREVGADGFIGKPCLPDDLVQRVQEIRAKTGRLPRRRPSPQARTRSTPRKRPRSKKR